MYIYYFASGCPVVQAPLVKRLSLLHVFPVFICQRPVDPQSVVIPIKTDKTCIKCLIVYSIVVSAVKVSGLCTMPCSAQISFEALQVQRKRNVLLALNICHQIIPKAGSLFAYL